MPLGALPQASCPVGDTSPAQTVPPLPHPFKELFFQTFEKNIPSPAGSPGPTQILSPGPHPLNELFTGRTPGEARVSLGDPQAPAPREQVAGCSNTAALTVHPTNGRGRLPRAGLQAQGTSCSSAGGCGGELAAAEPLSHPRVFGEVPRLQLHQC